ENLTFTAEEECSPTQQTETTENESTADAGTMEIFNCASCGAQIVTDATTAATYCYYCHNRVVLARRLSGEFLPENVLPFSIEKDEA
ncbi:TFIIB-type zinc ribbon-containing protein, partial [Enterococcus faecalis]